MGDNIQLGGETAGSEGTTVASPLLVFTFVLAFCSIVYELLLGQTLSAFLGNTVLRYSVTIGLYMFSMGIGALIAGPALLRSPVLSLQVVEIVLALLGLLSVPLVFLLDAAGLPVLLLSLVAHGMIIVIGVLTGLELPLLIEIQTDVDHAASRTLGVDYLGAFAGTIAFALWFYPQLGIVATAVFTAICNAVVGLMLPLYVRSVKPDIALSRGLLHIQGGVLAVLVMALIFYPVLEEYFIGLYIGH